MIKVEVAKASVDKKDAELKATKLAKSTVDEELAVARANILALTATLVGERALSSVRIAEATAQARDGMRAEVSAAFLEGIKMAKALIAEARAMK